MLALEKVSAAFLKKSSKKLLIPLGHCRWGARSPEDKIFLARGRPTSPTRDSNRP
jgi:hypothetical protein